jgi:5-methylcytosine-specific restriction protein B
MEPTMRNSSFHLPSGRALSIPHNLVFLATMNPEDRSVDELDVAMERRWGKVHLAPSAEVLESFLTGNGLPPEQRGAVLECFKAIQKHYALGHAFFRTVSSVASLQRLWERQLKFVFDRAFRFDADSLTDVKDSWDAMMKKLVPTE